MIRKKIDLGGQTFKDVFSFAFTHWMVQRWRVAGIVAVALLTALADVTTPLFAGRLVDALAGAGHLQAELVHMVATAAAYDGGPIAFRYPRGEGVGVEMPEARASAGFSSVARTRSPKEVRASSR